MRRLKLSWLGLLAGIYCLWTTLAFLQPGPALAGLDEGVAAWARGDYSAALRELRPLAEQGNAKAQLFLGGMYDNGLGVSQDYKEAVTWLRRAAEQGLKEAQYSLGLMYDRGRGVPKDSKEAFKWYRRAAEQGEATAQHNLGAVYADGRGAPKDYVQAHLWFSLAAAQGDGNAGKKRDIVTERMTPSQVAEAQRLAREWRPHPETSSKPERFHVNR